MNHKEPHHHLANNLLPLPHHILINILKALTFLSVPSRSGYHEPPVWEQPLRRNVYSTRYPNPADMEEL
eukprot:6387222-Amphidinium_carterae.2